MLQIACEICAERNRKAWPLAYPTTTENKKHFTRRKLQNVWSVGWGNDSWAEEYLHCELHSDTDLAETCAIPWDLRTGTRLYCKRQVRKDSENRDGAECLSQREQQESEDSENSNNSMNRNIPFICFYFVALCSHLFSLWCKNMRKAKLDEHVLISEGFTFHSDSSIISSGRFSQVVQNGCCIYSTMQNPSLNVTWVTCTCVVLVVLRGTNKEDAGCWEETGCRHARFLGWPRGVCNCSQHEGSCDFSVNSDVMMWAVSFCVRFMAWVRGRWALSQMPQVKSELDHLATFLKMAVAYKKKIGFKAQFTIEPKAREPTAHQYDYDAQTVIGFLYQLEPYRFDVMSLSCYSNWFNSLCMSRPSMSSTRASPRQKFQHVQWGLIRQEQ